MVSWENPSHFDVHQEVSPALTTWGPGIIYSRLLRFRSGPDVESPSLEMECDLCESWVQVDATTYLFQLRRGVRWHDVPPVNGRPLTADDIIYSYNRLRSPGFPNASLLSSLADIEALNERTLLVTLAHPDADFLRSIADGHAKVVAREAVEDGGDLRNGPNIGTGPWIWRFTEANLGSSFERNPDYFERGLPFLDGLNVNVIQDHETRLASFRTQVIDAFQIPAEDWERFTQSQSNAPLLRYREQGVGVELAINTARPPFDDLMVRRAVFNAMDPWRLNQNIWGGNAYVTLGFPVVESTWLLPEEDMRGYFGSPGEAAAILEEAGLDLPIEVELAVGDFGPEYLAYADRVAQSLRGVGFNPSVSVRNVREFGQQVWSGGDYTIFLGAPPPANTPNSYLLPVLHGNGSSNTAGYRSPDLDRLLELQARETDPQMRQSLMLDVQRHILDNAFRFMPATRISLWTWWPKVKHFHPNFSAAEYFHWARVWVEG